MDFFIIAIFAAIVFLGLAAIQWGSDSRTVVLDPRYPSGRGLS